MPTTPDFRTSVRAIVDAKHLLKHPFYQAWTQGVLTRSQLREYTAQYFHHVLAEPTYLSAIHSNTPHGTAVGKFGDVSVRQTILANLVDEEAGERNHPALWKSFAFALGMTESDLSEAVPLRSTVELVDTIKGICRDEPFYCGLAAMHAFESQVPAIAETKIDGLKKSYGFDAPGAQAGYSFFTVHQEADVHHAASEWEIIERYAEGPQKQAHVLSATTRTCDALWGFLDGVADAYGVGVRPIAAG